MVVCLMLGTVPVFAEMTCPMDGMKDKPKDGMMFGKGMKGKKGKKGKEDCGLSNVERYLKLKEELELTDEQVKMLEKIKLDYEKDNIKREADIKIIRLDLIEDFCKDKPDFDAARAKVKKIFALYLESKLVTIDAREKGYNVLTEGQKEKDLQFKKERKGKWMKNKKDKKKDKK